METRNELFVSPDEVEVDRLNMTAVSVKTAVEKNQLVLSNKRLYYKGAAMSMNGSSRYSKGEAIVDVKNITGTVFSVARNVKWLIIAIICMLIGTFVLVASGVAALGIAMLLIGGIYLLVYYVSAAKTLTVQYRGGVLAIQIKGVSKGTSVDAFRKFCKTIHATAKEA